MSITTRTPARSDLTAPSPVTDPHAPTRGTGPRGWAAAGVVAALAGAGSLVASGVVDSVYREDLRGDGDGLVAALADKVAPLLAFHVAALVAALALVVFGAGLYRRLAATTADSLAPLLALAGTVGTAAVLVVGTGLDTEYVFAFGEEGLVTPAEAAGYNHWIGTVPWCWLLTGLAGLALWSVARRGGLPRWIGVVGLVGGGLTLLVGVSPLQYLAGMVAPLWLLVASVGLLVGDRAFRSGSGR